VTDGTAVLADTHVFLWYLQASPRLEESTRRLLDGATAHGQPILVSAMTLVELCYLAEKGVLTELEVDAIHAVLDAEGSSFEVVPVDEAVGWALGRIPRDAVGDPFDRMIAATALVREVPLVTYDRKLIALVDLDTRR
jgi:PIN domain nuclease of toxin-antitoxin system